MSIRFQADNDLKFAIIKAVRRREPAIDFALAQESGKSFALEAGPARTLGQTPAFAV